MRAVFAILGVAVLMAFPVQASHIHTTSHEYTGAFGVGTSFTGNLAGLVLCPDYFLFPTDPDWDPTNDTYGEESGRGCANADPDVAPIGGNRGFAEDNHTYANVDVGGQDTTNLPLPVIACMILPEDDGICNKGGEGQDSGDADCQGGVARVTNAPRPHSQVTVFIHSVWVDGTTVCFGTTGGVYAFWF